MEVLPSVFVLMADSYAEAWLFSEDGYVMEVYANGTFVTDKWGLFIAIFHCLEVQVEDVAGVTLN